MREIPVSADRLVRILLDLKDEPDLCLLDCGGVSHLGSHLLIAGLKPLETLEISEEDPEKTLEILDEKLSAPGRAAIFTLSYDFGLKIHRVKLRLKEFPGFPEPDVYLALFDALVFHDYQSGKTFLSGNDKRFGEIESKLLDSERAGDVFSVKHFGESEIRSNFTRERYLDAVAEIQELIRRGDTYQTNLTRQISARLPRGLTAERIFLRLREKHPAPFAAFLRRASSAVVSASPERFLRIERARGSNGERRIVFASPIKGTRPRGSTPQEDEALRAELLGSAKDRAENVMIVDLLRNDIGRICEFGSVEVENLCDLEEHPTLFHLVSTVHGRLRSEVKFADVLRAAFPCGSITGAPKIRTMQVIDRIETAPRGLSMGAVGWMNFEKDFDLSVAIRTMTVRGGEAVFNVGGGVTIDSRADEEFDETRVKARALLAALNADF